MTETIISTDDSALKIYAEWLSQERADKLFEACKELPLVENPTFQMYGKTMTMHRSVGFFSDESVGYKYSKQMAKSQPLPKFLSKLLKRVNKKFDTDFNGILVNLYKDGTESIGAHSDDEKGLGAGGSVVGISLGATRNMRFRGKKTVLESNGKKFLDMPMPHGCVFIMSGDFQKEFTHEIPVQKTVDGMRISLTFRRHSE